MFDQYFIHFRKLTLLIHTTYGILVYKLLKITSAVNLSIIKIALKKTLSKLFSQKGIITIFIFDLVFIRIARKIFYVLSNMANHFFLFQCTCTLPITLSDNSFHLFQEHN